MSEGCGAAGARTVNVAVRAGRSIRYWVLDAVAEYIAVRRLYREIGRAGPRDSFETDAALDVEWQVRLECRRGE